MATKIAMENRRTGEISYGFYGFSWTTLLFGPLPALFRKDWIVFLIVLALNIATWGFVGVVWAFLYNKNYTIRLIRAGFAFAGNSSENELAARKLGIKLNKDNCITME
ncbi:hypothetical protein ABMH50_004026 [Escherichia albertii]|uniref:hypothetical protein n=1 Tax=Escherichia albertii TaxID=208962 RepID=UPI0030C8FBA7|nr:hypothetical protein [Escherichia albertii]